MEKKWKGAYWLLERWRKTDDGRVLEVTRDGEAGNKIGEHEERAGGGKVTTPTYMATEKNRKRGQQTEQRETDI